MKRSWETSATGLGAILAALGTALKAQFDGDPTTTPDWGLVISLSIAGIGLLRARDNNKTSEEVGADPASKAIRENEKAASASGLGLWLWMLLGLCGLLLVANLSGCASSEARTRFNAVQTQVVGASAGVNGWNIYKAQKKAELVTRKAAWAKMPDGPQKTAVRDAIEEDRRKLSQDNIAIRAALKVYADSLLLELDGGGVRIGSTNNAAELAAARGQVEQAEQHLSDTITRAQQKK